jgi:hypothetical protein
MPKEDRKVQRGAAVAVGGARKLCARWARQQQAQERRVACDCSQVQRRVPYLRAGEGMHASAGSSQHAHVPRCSTWELCMRTAAWPH